MNNTKKATIEIVRERTFDAAVIGGGVAGVSAAVAAARNGAKTVLIENGGVLGGQATLGMVTPLDSRTDLKGRSFGGIMKEVSDETEALSQKYCTGGETSGVAPIAAPHILKYVLLSKCEEAGVTVLFHTSLLAAETQKTGGGNEKEIKSVLVLTKNGAERIFAKVFIDGTGDGDLIAKSGTPFVLGAEKDCYAELCETGLDSVHESDERTADYGGQKLMQPVSIFFTLGGVDMKKAFSYNNKNFVIGDLGVTEEKLKKWEFYGSCGFEKNGNKLPLPQGRILVTRSARSDTAVVNMSRVLRIDGSDADELNEGEIKAQKQVIAITDFLKNFIDGFEDCYLIASANTLGVRETRRLKGKTVLRGIDVIYAKKFDYPIARGSYIIDIHDPTGKSKAIGGAIKGDYYEIPYGALVCEETSNLIVCGRCISADHVAHSSTRIQGTCMLTGEAAGTAAAISVLSGVAAAKIEDKIVHERLVKNGVRLEKLD